jgi:hypothetical protein
MPKRIPRWLARQSQEHRLMTDIIIFLLIVIPGYVVVEKQNADQAAQQQCGDTFADHLYAALAPREAAGHRIDDADAVVWEATQAILTQHAKPGDYITLRVAVKHRNRLWRELVAEQKAHPFPPPPDQFC